MFKIRLKSHISTIFDVFPLQVCCQDVQQAELAGRAAQAEEDRPQQPGALLLTLGDLRHP